MVAEIRQQEVKKLCKEFNLCCNCIWFWYNNMCINCSQYTGKSPSDKPVLKVAFKDLSKRAQKRHKLRMRLWRLVHGTI